MKRQHALLFSLTGLILSFGLFVFLQQHIVAAAPLSDKRITQLSEDVIFGSLKEQNQALRIFREQKQKNIIPTLILTLRYQGPSSNLIKTLQTLTGDKTITDWNRAMLWQEANPELIPHSSYRKIKLTIFEDIDPEFLRFLGKSRSLRDNMKIRLEEITWGGVRVDGIPSLDNPKLIEAKDANYLLDDDLVFGVEINGDVRAYPLRIMGWHEMFNEVIGGVPVALAYCTLCGSGILFETKVEGRAKPFIFGSSGFLYRSNKLMFDRETDSLWNQFTGQPVTGPLMNSGIKLKIRPVLITSWKLWQAKHPNTKVLSLETGHNRNYGSGVVYKEYFTSPDLMFPTIVRNEEKVRRKDYVYGIRDVGAAKAWPLQAFQDEPVINDTLGVKNVVLIGNHKTRSVRAYQRNTQTFQAGASVHTLKGPGGEWKIEENFIIGPEGTKLARIPGHISYWFAWDGYLGINSTLYEKAETKQAAE